MKLSDTLFTKQKMTTRATSPKHAQELAQTVATAWINRNRSKGWSILTVNLTQHASLIQEITHQRSATRDIGRLRTIHSLPTFHVTTLLTIFEYDQWTPRWLHEQLDHLAIPHKNRLFKIEHNTPLK